MVSKNGTRSSPSGIAMSSTSWPRLASRALASSQAFTQSGWTSTPGTGCCRVRPISSRPGGRLAWPRKDSPGGSGGWVYMSPGKLPVITSSSSAASATVRAIGPSTPKPSRSGASGPPETRPRDGLIPNSPQTRTGMRMDPAPSLPWAAGARPAATAAAAPPLDPPADRDRSHGVLAGGPILVSV